MLIALRSLPGLFMTYSGTLLLALLLTLQGITVAQATQVFVTRDSDGNFVFSDRASPNAETHTVKALPTVPALKYDTRLPEAETHSAATAEATPPYHLLSILYPRDQENLPPGISATLELIVGLRPKLKPQDTLVLLDNGTPHYEGRKLTIPVPHLDPGKHRLQLAIRNAHNDLVMHSDPITVYVQRHSILRQNSKQGTK